MRNIFANRVGGAALGLLLLPHAGTTQEPGAQRPPDRVPQPPVFNENLVVREVLLDVLVTDRSGNVVPDLGINDFVVYEDGLPAKLESVTFYGGPTALSASGPERTDRYFIFLFHHAKDLSTFQRSAQNRMARDARKWLLNERLPNDQVAVLSFDFDLWLHQDFTRDEDKILEAVDDAARGKKTATSRGDRGARIRRRSRAIEPPDSPSLFDNLPSFRDFRSQTRTFQDSLELVAKAAEGIVGRKNMLLFSPGFGQAGGVSDLHANSKIYQRLEQALNTSNVAVYCFDIQGIQSGDPRNASYGTMSQLSFDTGGRYFERDTNFLKPLQVVGHENLGYYLISYRSTHEKGASGYRKIEVSTTRSDYYARTRSGYRYGGEGTH